MTLSDGLILNLSQAIKVEQQYLKGRFTLNHLMFQINHVALARSNHNYVFYLSI